MFAIDNGNGLAQRKRKYTCAWENYNLKTNVVMAFKNWFPSVLNVGVARSAASRFPYCASTRKRAHDLLSFQLRNRSTNYIETMQSGLSAPVENKSIFTHTCVHTFSQIGFWFNGFRVRPEENVTKHFAASNYNMFTWFVVVNTITKNQKINVLKILQVIPPNHPPSDLMAFPPQCHQWSHLSIRPRDPA